ncbi:MAG: efflux RND transporter permease subunit [Candidatus Eremiobacteraeota bacterium]|nr:efflux RND transporter permease subunit [Candidatus Eremiobacteraeota bacterium]
MWLTRLFIQRPTLVFVLLALISIGGILAAKSLVQQQYPNVDLPTVSINVSYSGASTTVMRDNIVAPIEDQLAGTPDLQTISSVIQTGQGSITCSFDINSDVATDLVSVQKAVQAAQRQLPTDLTAPSIGIRDPSQSVVVTLEAYSDSLDPAELSLLANGRIGPTIQQIDGVSNVNINGQVTPAYEVTVDPIKLSAAGLTLNDIVNTIGANNVRAPGGIIYQPNRETQIDIRGDVIDPSSILGLPISVPVTNGGSAATSSGLAGLAGPVNSWTASNAVRRVADIATVVAGAEPRRVYAAVTGVNSMFVQVQKSSGASEVTASNNVLNDLPQIERQFPQVKFSVVNVQSRFTKQQIDSVLHTLAEGVFLTGIVMLFFLRSWRNAIVVLIAIPSSLFVAMGAMKILGMTLDTISLLAMTLVVGILVDDSTVVLENIERHHDELGQDPKAAAISGRTEIGFAAITITLVDVVVFLPIAFMQGQVGKQLFEFSIVVVISTLTSLFISFTITPALAGLWALRSKWKPWAIIDRFGEGFDRVRNWYAHRALPWGLERPRLVAGVCAASFLLAMAMVPLGVVGSEFIPAQDRGEIYVQIVYPVGTPLEHTKAGTFALEHAIDRGVSDLQADTTVAGAYAASFGGFVSQGNVGQVHVWLKDGRKHDTAYWLVQIRKMSAKLIHDATVVVLPSTGSGGGNAQPVDELVTDVSGGDPTPYAQQLLKVLDGIKGATSVNSSASQLTPQIEVIFDRARAQALNVSIGTAATAARAAFGGAIATQFETPDGLEQVQVIYPLSYQTDVASLAAVAVRTNTGGIVHLSDFATFKVAPTEPLITRVNRNTVIHLNANIAPGASLSGVQRAFMSAVRKLHLPQNISVRPAPLGQQDLMGQTLTGLGAGMVLSVLLVFLLMVALYNSYREPFINLFAVPVAAVGAIGALILTRSTLNLFSLIGTILLIGIVTKNSILLVDYANTLRSRGREKLDAVKESAYTRFRPIIMTSISVIAGNIPLALALEPGSSVRASLGVVVIGGISSSLVLTLVLVPIMYMWLAPKDKPAPADLAPAPAPQPQPVPS